MHKEWIDSLGRTLLSKLCTNVFIVNWFKNMTGYMRVKESIGSFKVEYITLESACKSCLLLMQSAYKSHLLLR